MVLSPPAEFHLSDYLRLVAEQRLEDTHMHKKRLRRFLRRVFGCLASGLDFLQCLRIWLPVSLNRILVYKENVLFPPSYGNKGHGSRSSLPVNLDEDTIDMTIIHALRTPCWIPITHASM
jgi:hypothetical protein